MIAAFVIYGAITATVASIVRAQTGVVIEPWMFHPVMLWAPLGLIALTAIAGLVPAAKAYRVDVAENLAPTQ
jgi:putative ABC transport system permease protein